MSGPSISEKLQRLAQLRVFFAHQSVGSNLLTGLERICVEHGVRVRIQEGRGAAPFAEPGIIHAHVGKNTDPLSKLSDFAALLEEGAGGSAGVALMKLCYIDFHGETDAGAIFAAFSKRHSELQARFADTRFLVMTVPLTTVQRGLKAVLRDRIGTGARGAKENIKRHQFNELLRAEYAGRPFFDLAAIESAGTTYERDGGRWPALREELTDDGGHLNEAGQRELVPAFIDALLLAAAQ